MNLSWYLFFGRKLGMSRQETATCDFDEMRDMIACLNIYNGIEDPAPPEMSQDEILHLR